MSSSYFAVQITRLLSPRCDTSTTFVSPQEVHRRARTMRSSDPSAISPGKDSARLPRSHPTRSGHSRRDGQECSLLSVPSPSHPGGPSRRDPGSRWSSGRGLSPTIALKDRVCYRPWFASCHGPRCSGRAVFSLGAVGARPWGPGKGLVAVRLPSLVGETLPISTIVHI